MSRGTSPAFPDRPERPLAPPAAMQFASNRPCAEMAAGRSGRYADRITDWRARAFGIAGTTWVGLAMIGCATFTWRVLHPSPPPTRPMVVQLLPLASPPEPVRDVAPGPQQMEHQARKPENRPVPDDPVLPVPAVPIPMAPTAAAKRPERQAQPEPLPPVAQTTAPRAITAPAADRLSNASEANWESALLAHLERFRRYPARARAARQQGTVYVRFRMNRAGIVLEAKVVRGGGSFALDQSALDTLARAQPLPAIPPDRPDVVELTVPVEFHLG
jgi:periplasmic protein TonB